MSRDAAIETCREIVETVCSGLTAVIYAHPTTAAVPRPALPYAAVRWLTGRERYQQRKSWWRPVEGKPSVATWSSRTYMEGLMRVDFYGPGSMAFADALKAARTKPSVIKAMDDAEDDSDNNLGLRMHLQTALITDATRLRETAHEESSYLDTLVSWFDRDTETTEPIETIKVVGDGDLAGIEETIP